MKLKFYFHTAPWADLVEIYLIGEDAAGKRFLAKPMDLAFEPMPADLLAQPTIKIGGFMSREFLPALANALAESGYRAESTDAGELKATKYHLEDLRLIAQREVRALSQTNKILPQTPTQTQEEK